MSHKANLPEAVGRALRTLTHATPPAEMQVRLEHRLRATQAEQTVRRRPAPIALICCATGAAATVAIFLALPHQHPESIAKAKPTAQRPAISQSAAATRVSVAMQGASRPKAIRSKPQRRELTTVARTSQVPTPLPLTDQERLLVALANTPSLAASASASEPIADHGLGPDALRELDHEKPSALHFAALEFASMPPQPFHPISPGENK